MELRMPKDDYVKMGIWKNKNLYSFLEGTSNSNGDREAVVDSFNRYTYSELNRQVQKMAGALVKSGIEPGDVVSFQLPNWAEAAVIHQALLMIGAISNPIMPIYRKKELEYILTTSQTKILFIPHTFRNFNYLEMIRELDNVISLRKTVILDSYNDIPALNQDNEILYTSFIEFGGMHTEVYPVDEKTIALLLFTSGTTGNPKGVLHSHNTLLSVYEQSIIPTFGLSTDDVVFIPSPIAHITGFMMGLELPFTTGCKVVFQDIWDSKTAVKLMLEEGVTWSIGATPFLRGILSEFEQLRPEMNAELKLQTYLCGGTDVPPELIMKARKELNCTVGRVYGSSETSINTIICCHDSLEKAALTDGRVAEGTSVIVMDDNGNELPRNETGEIGIKGISLFLGYLQPEFNQHAYTEEGYFLTGDLGILDEEGYLRIYSRKKDIVIRGGENISVKEIEEILTLHPSIAEVAIVAMPDEIMGEKACAYVVPKQGRSFTFSEMTAFLNEHDIAQQKFPERLELIEQMPMTASGKIQKFKLREDIKSKL